MTYVQYICVMFNGQNKGVGGTEINQFGSNSKDKTGHGLLGQNNGELLN